MHLRSAFRHEIGLPEHLVPDVWKDMKRSKEESPQKRNSAVADAMNRRVDWVRIPEELESLPYPPKIYTACFVYNESIETKTSEIHGEKDFPWKFVADASTELHTCDILSRDNLGKTVDEVIARAGSTRPIPVLFTATVSFPERKLNLTGIPRTAIRFLQQHS